jgi:hypothetical protein
MYSLKLFRGDQHGYLAIMALNPYRLALRLVEDGGEVLFGVGCGDGLHG